MSLFRKAERSRTYLKLAVMGPSGAGKSYSALRLARGLVGPEGRIAAIDTENGSLSLYAGLTQFDVVDLAPPFTPERYTEIVLEAVAEGYDCLLIDSFSHAWKQVLDDKSALDARGGNQYANWRGPKQRMDKLKDSVLQARTHVVCCLRAKTEYVQDGGKITKAGMAAIGEPDVEYEFTTVFDVAPDHRALAGVDGRGKDRTGLFGPLGAIQLSEEHGRMLREWLDGAAVSPSEKMRQATDYLRSLDMDGPARREFADAAGETWPDMALAAKAKGIPSPGALIEFALPEKAGADEATL